MDILLGNIGLTFLYATPIILAALGGLFSERSGIVNIALEGIMLVGAFFAATVCHYMAVGSDASSAYAIFVIPWVSVLVGALAGMLFSLLHAVASIRYKANQVISGTALNMLSLGLTVFLAQVIFNQQRTDAFQQGFQPINPGFLSDVPVIGKLISSTYQPFYVMLIIVFITLFVINKTKFGLRLRACGEYPQAAASMGINVSKMRYTGVLISGFLAGMAGSVLVLTVDSEFSASVINGTGFIALATLIFGKWKPLNVLYAGLFFGAANVLALFAGGTESLNSIPTEVFQMIPFIITIIALVVTSGKEVGPKAAGEIYDEGKR